MKIKKLNFKNTHIITPNIFKDQRGYFFEVLNLNLLSNKIFNSKIKQVNQSFSKKNVIRGIHFQKYNQQHQFFYLSQGMVKLVLVDFRKKSSTFLKKIYLKLNSDKIKVIHTPPGVGSAFLTLSSKNTMVYIVDKSFKSGNEIGVMWNDKDLKIKWGIKKPIISIKDNSNKLLKDIDFNKIKTKL